MLQMGTRYETVLGDKIEILFQRRDLQGPRQPGILSFQQKEHIPQNYMVDQERLQISELQFDKIPTTSTFSLWKIRFKTQVSASSGSPSKAMLWIKEVEMVDSVDDLKIIALNSREYSFPEF